MTFHVCPDCGGKGTQDTLGAFSQNDVDEWYAVGEEQDEFYRRYRAGAYDEDCLYCKGKRVVTDEQIAAWDDEIAYRQEIEAERRMGC